MHIPPILPYRVVMNAECVPRLVLRESFENPLSRLVRFIVLLLLCPTLPSLGVSEALGGRRVR